MVKSWAEKQIIFLYYFNSVGDVRMLAWIEDGWRKGKCCFVTYIRRSDLWSTIAYLCLFSCITNKFCSFVTLFRAIKHNQINLRITVRWKITLISQVSLILSLSNQHFARLAALHDDGWPSPANKTKQIGMRLTLDWFSREEDTILTHDKYKYMQSRYTIIFMNWLIGTPTPSFVWRWWTSSNGLETWKTENKLWHHRQELIPNNALYQIQSEEERSSHFGAFVQSKIDWKSGAFGRVGGS